MKILAVKIKTHGEKSSRDSPGVEKGEQQRKYPCQILGE